MLENTALWCNGSTADFDSVSFGSNPDRATKYNSMKNWKKIALIVAAVAVVGFLIWTLVTYTEPQFKPEPFPINNTVANLTGGKTYLDTIVHLSLNALDFKGLVVVIQPLTPAMQASFSQTLELRAQIKPDADSTLFHLYVGDIGKSEAIGVISHEMIHLQQYYLKQLVVKNDTPIWESRAIPITSVDYEYRPWEVQAVNRSRDLEWILKHKLYNIK